MMSLSSYLTKLEKFFEHRNGKAAANLLGFRDAHIYQASLQVKDPESECERNLSQPLDEVAAAHLRCCWAVANHDFIEAYSCQSICVQAFLRLFSSQKDEKWALPVLFAVTLDLRLFANSADIQLIQSGHGKLGDTLEKAAEILMSCFRICASDNRAPLEHSKKWGMLNLVNQLFKIYFKINKLHLCKPLIRAIDSLPIKDTFSISQLVTYRFYVGRKAMFDSDYKSAEDYLTFAFQRCHKGARKNKRLILIYLLPVKMLLGHMPKRVLLEKYDLLQFSDVARGVSSGNLSLLNKALELNEAFFVKCGIYLILEKLKTITYRNLIKKVTLIQKTHQLPINAFTVAFRWMGDVDIDDDEMQCIIANLIYEDKIKGYISFQHKKLVVSKANAFPPLSVKLKS